MKIGSGEECCEVAEFHVHIAGALARNHRVVAQQIDVETGQSSGHEPANVAQADDANCFFGELATGEFLLFPLARPGRGISGNDVSAIGEHKGYDLLGDGIGIGPGGVHHVDRSATGVLCIDGVGTRRRRG